MRFYWFFDPTQQPQIFQFRNFKDSVVLGQPFPVHCTFWSWNWIAGVKSDTLPKTRKFRFSHKQVDFLTWPSNQIISNIKNSKIAQWWTDFLLSNVLFKVRIRSWKMYIFYMYINICNLKIFARFGTRNKLLSDQISLLEHSIDHLRCHKEGLGI